MMLTLLGTVRDPRTWYRSAVVCPPGLVLTAPVRASTLGGALPLRSTAGGRPTGTTSGKLRKPRRCAVPRALFRSTETQESSVHGHVRHGLNSTASVVA
jgi:hypothetical protein